MTRRIGLKCLKLFGSKVEENSWKRGEVCDDSELSNQAQGKSSISVTGHCVNVAVTFSKCMKS